MVRCRKAQTSLMFEVVISLVFVGLFAYATFTFISQNANSDDFFSRFYAVDLATSADVVNAGYGDVMLRYDNLKPTQILKFSFTNGAVLVGPPTSNSVNAGIVTQTYGHPKEFYADFFVDQPLFLLLRKTGPTFSVAEIDSTVKTCAIPMTKAIRTGEMKLYIDVTKSIAATAPAQIRAAAKSILARNSITLVDRKEDANCVITVSIETGTEDAIEFKPTSGDGKSIACLFLKELNIVSLKQFSANEPAPGSAAGGNVLISLEANLKTTGRFSDEDVGTAIGNALTVYYRSSSMGTASGTPSAFNGKSTGNVLLVGDSLTTGYAPAFKCGSRVVSSYMKSGRPAFDMVKDIDSYLSAKPGLVIIWGGINDILSYPESKNSKTVIADLDSMRSKVLKQNPQAKVLFVTLPPFKGYSSMYNGKPVTWTEAKQTEADKINAWIRAQPFIEVTQTLLDKNNDQQYDAGLSADNLHPKEYTQITKFIQEKSGCSSG